MDSIKDTVSTKPLTLIGVFAAVTTAYIVGSVIYRLYFHPLSKIPGPKINALTRIPYVRHLMAGTTVDNVTALHEKYGEVVRLTPNEVSFTSGETAWPEIYGFRTGTMKGHLNMQKDPAWYAPSFNGAPSILLANDENHSRGRRTLTHAFSEKALANQEELLQKYVDQLVGRLKEVTSESSEPVDLTKWYNWTTFDVVADLLFGEPFGCLQDLKTHKYIDLLFKALEGFRLHYVFLYYPYLKRLGGFFVDQTMITGRIDFGRWVTSQTEKRIARDTQRPDFMTEILKHNGEKGLALSNKEMASNANLILIAGSETTATMLSGTTYALLKNPKVMQKLKEEVRGRWKSYGDITQEDVNKAPYLCAVISEGLRYFPPVPTGFERRVGKGGEFVSGYYLPEGTAVGVSQFPAYRSESNFKDATSFVPERWMGDARYAGDKRGAYQPFSFGPRNCLGKNLAYAEMRLILAKIIWTFDMELEPRSENWIERCKMKTLWDKPELAVKVTAVQ